MTWTELPDGKALALAPGHLVAVVASVKASHTAADVAQLAATKGLTLLDYAEEGQRAGLGPDPRGPAYRYVAAIARPSKAGSLPWSTPFPVSVFDGSSIVRAWSEPDVPAAPLAPPAPPAPVRVGVTPVALWPLWGLPIGAVLMRVIRGRA